MLNFLTNYLTPIMLVLSYRSKWWWWWWWWIGVWWC